VAPGPLPSSARDHPSHPEPGSLLTEFVDGFESPPRADFALLSVRATAKHLGVSLATVYSLVATRQLHCVRISNAIRIHPGDLAAYLALRRE
jgi:excisionase family DNA binding protein